MNHSEQMNTALPKRYRFSMTYCSQCGCELGAGDSGVSHCEDHAASLSPPERIEADPFYGIAAADRPLPTTVKLGEA